MRAIVFVFSLMLMIGCDTDHALLHTNEERREVVVLTINKNGEVFISVSDSSTTLDYLSQDIRQLLDSPTRYSFVIHSDEDTNVLARRAREILYQEGVEKGHLAISKKSKP